MADRARWMASFIEQQQALIDRFIQQGECWATLVSQMSQTNSSATQNAELELLAALLPPVDQMHTTDVYLHHWQKRKSV